MPVSKLSVGCGRRSPEAGLVRLDCSAEVSPDVVWDLNQHPYPFEPSTFDEIECMDVIEHLGDIVKAMEGFHRILKPGGVLKITTPHFSCANSFVDPTHRWHLSFFSFDYFCTGHALDYYSPSRFRIRTRAIQFDGGRFRRSLVRRLVMRFPHFYEQRLAWMFPAWFLYFELEAVK